MLGQLLGPMDLRFEQLLGFLIYLMLGQFLGKIDSLLGQRLG